MSGEHILCALAVFGYIRIVEKTYMIYLLLLRIVIPNIFEPRSRNYPKSIRLTNQKILYLISQLAHRVPFRSREHVNEDAAISDQICYQTAGVLRTVWLLDEVYVNITINTCRWTSIRERKYIFE